MVSRARRITSARSVKARAKAPPSSAPENCVVFGCHKPTQRSARNGFSETYCASHVEHLRRHGHPSRPSYRGWELAPYRAAVKAWLKDHADHPTVAGSVGQLDALTWAQGRSKTPDYQRSMVPKDKARNVLAKLHEAGKTGQQLLEIVIVVEAAYRELGPHGYPDWISIQVGKLAKRLKGASGTVARNHEGRRMVDIYPHASNQLKRQWHKWPRSEGRYIRILGEMIHEKIGTELVEIAVEDIRQAMRGDGAP